MGYPLQLLSGVWCCERPADARRCGVSGSFDDRRPSSRFTPLLTSTRKPVLARAPSSLEKDKIIFETN